MVAPVLKHAATLRKQKHCIDTIAADITPIEATRCVTSNNCLRRARTARAAKEFAKVMASDSPTPSDRDPVDPQEARRRVFPCPYWPGEPSMGLPPPTRAPAATCPAQAQAQHATSRHASNTGMKAVRAISSSDEDFLSPALRFCAFAPVTIANSGYAARGLHDKK